MDLIEQLITETKADLDQKRILQGKVEQDKKDQAFKSAFEAMKTSLGDLWADLIGSLESHTTFHPTNNTYETRFYFGAQPEKQLRPFWIAVYNQHVSGQLEASYKQYELPDELGSFLLAQREWYPAWAERERKKTVSDLLQGSLRWDDPWITLEQAQEATEKLQAMFPGDGDWGAYLEDFKARRSQKAAREVAEAEYRYALQDYKVRLDAAIARNRGRLDQIEKRVNQIQVAYWKLTYCLTSEVESPTVEMDLVLADHPNRHGYWPVVVAGKVTDKRYFNPVSLEGPLFATAASGPGELKNSIYVDKAQAYFVYLLATVLTNHELRELEPLPESPNCPRELEDHIARWLESEMLSAD